MNNKSHKCRYRLTNCPFIDGPCKTCKSVNYNPEATFSEDDLACHDVRHLFKKGDIIPDIMPESRIIGDNK